jgi:hypothetical protein
MEGLGGSNVNDGVRSFMALEAFVLLDNFSFAWCVVPKYGNRVTWLFYYDIECTAWCQLCILGKKTKNMKSKQGLLIEGKCMCKLGSNIDL